MRLIFFWLLFFFFIMFGWWHLIKKNFFILDDTSLPEKFFTYIIKKVKRRNNRIYALKKAAQFLTPYENIFADLILANKFCTVKLNSKEKSIKLRNKKYNNKGEKAVVTAECFTKIDADECFNHLCDFFGFKTTFDEVNEILGEYSKLETEIIDKTEPSDKTEEPVKKPEITEKIEIKHVVQVEERDFSNKIDINNSSESELIGLPGINIIMAKKIIKFREEEHQFYSVDEFFRIMKIKQHFVKQLRELIIVKKINIKKVKKARRERIIDI